MWSVRKNISPHNNIALRLQNTPVQLNFRIFETYIVNSMDSVSYTVYLLSSSFLWQTSYSSVTKDILLNGRNLTILVGHWFLHAFGIISLTQLTDLTIHLPILALVPFPTLFFILTIQFSNPSHLEDVRWVLEDRMLALGRICQGILGKMDDREFWE
jgi:hypothetical protein